ncbi:hypothetical protein PbB2_00059 [Candidatus Phycosocius bacilliformis]|uniref:Uncharacterized protein n=1 Tax=Candidatus Phycosocius bacilliformis TaxID=1445552 RepID=A0A2P2E5R6_9PROT|nr:hypothetical protein PbB2_00059 [Candidatus Phycosocius bacilliformis]
MLLGPVQIAWLALHRRLQRGFGFGWVSEAQTLPYAMLSMAWTFGLRLTKGFAATQGDAAPQALLASLANAGPIQGLARPMLCRGRTCNRGGWAWSFDHNLSALIAARALLNSWLQRKVGWCGFPPRSFPPLDRFKPVPNELTNEVDHHHSLRTRLRASAKASRGSGRWPGFVSKIGRQ